MCTRGGAGAARLSIAAIVCAAARGVRGLGLLSPGPTATHRANDGTQGNDTRQPFIPRYIPCAVPYRIDYRTTHRRHTVDVRPRQPRMARHCKYRTVEPSECREREFPIPERRSPETASRKRPAAWRVRLIRPCACTLSRLCLSVPYLV